MKNAASSLQVLKSKKAASQGRVRAIDGLRAIAIIAVMCYHLRLPWVPSGHLGVVVFLVLGGYFATTSFVRAFERDELGPVSIARLWWNRLRRVWPSVAALVFIVAILCSFLSHVLLTKLRPDALPALGFFLNWSYILRDLSYFDQIGGTSPLLHLWYLGVDLQFFLVWSLVCAAFVRVGKPTLRRVALVLAAASAVWMYQAYVPGADPTRVYYGTDTRAFSMLLGAWLALAFPLGKVPVVGRPLLIKTVEPHGSHSNVQRYRATVFASLMGLLALAGLIACMVLVPADDARYYRGGFLCISLAVVVLVATLLAPRSLLGFVLGSPVFSWLGTRSFALYLWHYPIFLLMEANKTTTPWWMRLAAVGVALVAAELSLRLVERPFAPVAKDAPQKPAPARLVVTALVLCCAGGYAAYVLDITPKATLVPEEAIVSTGVAVDQAREIEPVGADGSVADGQQAGDEATGAGNAGEKTTDADKQTPARVEVDEDTVVYAPASESSTGVRDPVLIGDSVPGDAVWTTRLPNILEDCYIGRRPDQALEVFRGYEAQGVVGHVVVFATFSNTTPSIDQLEELVSISGPDRKVFFVGTFNPDGFQDAANNNLQEVADRYDNVSYIDWPSVVTGNEGAYLWADVTHLRPEGAEVYVDMIVRAIAQDLVDEGGTVGTLG